MRTQSIDTHPEAERVQIEIMRGFSIARKFEIVVDMMHFLSNANQIFRRGPEQRIAALYGTDWLQRYRRFIHSHAALLEQSEPGDLCAAVLAATASLERRSIPYAITGRLACSIYGLHSSLTSIELLIQHPRHLILSPIHTRHQDTYLDVVHLLCLDVTRTSSAITTAIPQVLIEGHPPLMMLSPEAVTLGLLTRYAKTGYRDDALYNDILGMVKVQWPHMNITELLTQSTDLALTKSLLEDAGVIR